MSIGLILNKYDFVNNWHLLEIISIEGILIVAASELDDFGDEALVIAL